MSKLKVDKLESTNKKPLEIIGNVIFSGNVSIVGTLTGVNITNTTILSPTTIVNNTTINDTDLPLISSLGENSLKQKGESNFVNFGKNSTSLGDYNNSNGDYSNTLGSYNISGSKQYDFIKVPNTDYLLILDKEARHSFVTGNTKTYQVVITGSCRTGTTVTVTNVTNYFQSAPNITCAKYSIEDGSHITNFQLKINYVDCKGVARTKTFPVYNPFTQGGCITCKVYNYVAFSGTPYSAYTLMPLNEVSGKTPITIINLPNFDIPEQDFSLGFPGFPNLTEWFQMECTGQITFPYIRYDLFYFKLNSDDGSIFRIYNINYTRQGTPFPWLYGEAILNNDGLHNMVVDAYLQVSAKTGTCYSFRMSYFQGPGTKLGLQLHWNYQGTPALPWPIVSPSAFNSCGCSIPYSSNTKYSICSKTEPTYVIPPQFSARTATITANTKIEQYDICCLAINTTAYTSSYSAVTLYSFNDSYSGAQNCYTYEFDNRFTGRSIRFTYTPCHASSAVTLTFYYLNPIDYPTINNNILNKFKICSSTPPIYANVGRSIYPFAGILPTPRRIGHCCPNYLILFNYNTATTANLSVTSITWNDHYDCQGNYGSQTLIKVSDYQQAGGIDICSPTPPPTTGNGWDNQLVVYPDNSVSGNRNSWDISIYPSTIRCFGCETVFCEYNGICYTATTYFSGTSKTISSISACPSVMPMTGKCVTYRFENIDYINNSNTIFWTDCQGIIRSHLLYHVNDYLEVCAVKNSVYAVDSRYVKIEEIYSGCCITDFTSPCTVIHNFSGHSNGTNVIGLDGALSYPTIIHENNVIYGTTLNGGNKVRYTNVTCSPPYVSGSTTEEMGIIFSCDTNGNNYKIMHRFAYNYNDNTSIKHGIPQSGLYKASNGLLYGTVSRFLNANNIMCNYNFGAIYSFNLNNGQYTHLAPFSSETTFDLSYTYAKLMERSSEPGFLYGVMKKLNLTTNYSAGTMVFIYKYDISLNHITYYIHPFNINFYNYGHGPDESYTQLYELSSNPGFLYGTSYYGGVGQTNDGYIFSFEISTAILRMEWNFDFIDGIHPRFCEWAEKNGTLYGTTTSGGLNNAGTIFSYHPNNGFRVIYNFLGGRLGSYPTSLMFGSNGKLYGVVLDSSYVLSQVIYSYDLDTGHYNVLYSKYEPSGYGNTPLYGISGLIEINQCFYGGSVLGGLFGKGTIYKVCYPQCTTNSPTSSNLIIQNSDTYDNTNPISTIETVDSNATAFDNGGSQFHTEVTSISEGMTSSEGIAFIGGTVMYDLPQNTNYTLLKINSNFIPNEGIIISNYFGESASAQGMNTQAKGPASHSEGNSTLADGQASHAEGIMTNAFGEASHAGGIGTLTNHTGEFARSSGMFNSIGDAQYSIITAYGKLSGLSVTYLYVNGINENIKIKKNSTVIVELELVGIVSDDTNNENLIGEGFVIKGLTYMINNNQDGELTITSLGSNRYVGTVTNVSVGSLTLDMTSGNTFDEYSEIKIFVTGTEESLTFNCLLKINMTQIKI